MQSYFKYKINKIARKQKITDRLERILLKNKNFAIVSNNCWNIGIYKNLNREFNTPFIGLAINSADFIKVITNLNEFLSVELNSAHFINSNDYPIALLNNVKIHFIHYHDSVEAADKWNRRKDRLLDFINKQGVDSVIFKCCDKDSMDKADHVNFNKLNFKRKIYISKKSNAIILNRDGSFPDGIKLYNVRLIYYFRYLGLFNKL